MIEAMAVWSAQYREHLIQTYNLRAIYSGGLSE
jgi:hypothetical protein